MNGVLGEILLMRAVVFVVNLLPAFAPPTWIVLVYFRLRHDVPLVPLVVGGAAASAGLTPQIRLVPVTLAFFCGRLVTYTIYVTGATLAKASLTALLDDGVTSPWSVALQVALLALLAAFVFTPWARILARHQPHEPG